MCALLPLLAVVAFAALLAPSRAEGGANDSCWLEVNCEVRATRICLYAIPSSTPCPEDMPAPRLRVVLDGEVQELPTTRVTSRAYCAYTELSYAVLRPSSETYWVRGNEVIRVTPMPAGLLKEVIQPGDGKTFPQKGDTVVAHYTGRLVNGEEFDSSVSRGKPFTFPLGMGRVIQGWDEGFAKMSVGEKAFLYIPFTMAYGERGYPPLIPPRSTLVFEVELLGIEGKGAKEGKQAKKEL